MFDINAVKVYRNKDIHTDLVEVYNPKGYEMIGIGYHGAVFKLSENRCVKVFASLLNARQEAEIYKAMKSNKNIPIMYGYGSNYIILELIKGKMLCDYLKQTGYLSMEITIKLIDILRNTRYKNYICTDIELNNIMIDENESLRLIDLCEILWMDDMPNFLFKELKDIEMLDTFLMHIKQIDFRYYTRLKQNMAEYQEFF